MTSLRPWLEAELERIWLGTEYELRRLQQLELRPPRNAAAVAEVEATLAQRRAQRLGAPADPDPAELLSALGAVRQKLLPLRASVIPRFVERLQLSLSDLDGLLYIAAPSIDPPLADLFATVRGTAMARRGVDLALIGDLLGPQRERRVQLLSLLDEERPPIALRLIQVAPAADVYSSTSYRSIQPTLDLLWLLTADDEGVSPSLASTARIVRRAGSFDGLFVDAPTRSWLQPLADRFRQASGSGLPWTVLWGDVGSGKQELAARLAGFAGKPLVSLNPKTIDKANLPGLLRRACRDAAWLGAALYVGPLSDEQLLDQTAAIDELEQCREPVFLGFACTQAPRLKTTHPLGEYPLPVPQAPTQLAIWRHALGDAPLALNTDIESVARGYKLTPGEILESAREALALAGTAPLDDRILRGVLERRLRNELGAIATRIIVNTSWRDIILPPDAEARVRELIARKRYEDQVYRQWGLDRRIGYGKGIIGLFSGPPGTGKTLLAGLIAEELGFELYQVDLSQIFSRWVGETEKALAKVFDQAERAHAVLLFDEADALFAKRTEVEDSHDRYANVAVNFLLQRLERYSGVALLTTNKDAYLDEALKRRLSLHLHLEEPEAPERLRLWEKHLPADVPGADGVDLEAIAADYELSGGYIKNVALRASFLSAAEDVPLSTEQVRRAAILELEDMGRVVFWPSDLEASTNTTQLIADYVEG